MTPFGAPAHRIGTSAAGKRIHDAGVAFEASADQWSDVESVEQPPAAAQQKPKRTTVLVRSIVRGKVVWETRETFTRPPPCDPSPRVVEAVQKALNGPPEVDPAPMGRIVKAVCSRFGVSKLDLISQRRIQTISRPRQIAMYLARHLTTFSQPQIARFLGNKDHTTVIHGIRRIDQLMKVDAELRTHVEALVDQLASGT